MIEYKKGNLLDVTEGVIAHGCNSYGVMGSGVVLAVKEKYPKAFAKYKVFCDNNQEYDILGQSVAVLVTDDLLIVNMITQENFGRDPNVRYVSYDAIDSCFDHLRRSHDETLIVNKNAPILNIPKIGAGLGNGNWNVISEIIEHRYPYQTICWEL